MHVNSPLTSKFQLKIEKSVFVQEQKGKIIAKYRVLEILGQGTFGVVRKI